MPRIALELLENDSRNANVCDQVTLAKLKKNMARSGFCPMVVVRPSILGTGVDNKPKRYVIVDGHHRVLVARELGWKDIECQVVEIDAQEATLLLCTLNRLRGEDSPRKRAELIDELLQSIPIEDITQLLPESKHDIDDLLSLLTTDVDAMVQQVRKQQEAEEAGLPVPFTFLVPRPDVDIVEKALAKATKPTKKKADRAEALVFICKRVLETDDGLKKA